MSPLFRLGCVMNFADSICKWLKIWACVAHPVANIGRVRPEDCLVNSDDICDPICQFCRENTAPINSSLGIDMTFSGAKRLFEAISCEVKLWSACFDASEKTCN